MAAGLLGFVSLVLLLVPEVAVGAPLQGVLDRSFGGDGRVLSDLGNARVNSRFTTMVRQPNGKLVLAGSVGVFGHVIERREPSGALDGGFGAGGAVRVPNAGEVAKLAVLGDGRIVFGVPGGCGHSTVRRLLPAGTPDPSFGSNGVSTPVPLGIGHLAVDAVGRILVAGETGNRCQKSSPLPAPAIARLTANGSLDPTFGDEGVVQIDAEGEPSFATGLAVRGNGTIIVASNRRLLALSADGTIDPSFGTGRVLEEVGRPKALLALPGGGVLVAGSGPYPDPAITACCRTPGDFVLGRYRPDGSLDPSFGSGGTARLDVGEVDDASALALEPDGSIVLAGAAGAKDCSWDRCLDVPILARFTADGVLDPGFGVSGWTSVDIPHEAADYTYSPHLAALAIAPGGQILVAGGAVRSDAFVLARDGSGRPDPSFGSAGTIAEVRTRPSETKANGLAVTSSGRILVSATSNAGARISRRGLLVSKPNGGFDPEIGSGSGFAADEAMAVLWAGRGNHVYSLGSGRVTRFDARGRPDRGYGSEGAASLPSGFRAIALAVRRDGEAVAVGSIGKRSGMAAFGLTSRGRPDSGFGHNGLALVGFGGTEETEARVVAIDRRGRVVLVGRSGEDAIAARLLPSGRLDRRFGRGGRLRRLPISGRAETGISLQGDGVLIAGREAGRAKPISLLRVGSDGSRDPSFGRNGTLRTAVRGPGLLLVASRRQIVFVHTRRPGGGGGVVLRAYEPDGAVDRGFGRRGVVVVTSRQPRYYRPAAAARRPDGRIVVAATSGKAGRGADVELLRFR